MRPGRQHHHQLRQQQQYPQRHMLRRDSGHSNCLRILLVGAAVAFMGVATAFSFSPGQYHQQHRIIRQLTNAADSALYQQVIPQQLQQRQRPPTAASAPLQRGYRHRNIWKLHEVIRADVWDAEPFDVGQGGVQLAIESAVKISGTVQHRPGKAEAKPLELVRYRQLQSLSQATVTKVLLDECKAQLVCVGQGKEFYKDPGRTTVKEVVYAPHEAMRDALQAAGSVLNADRIVINVLGGDDLQLPEVMDALHFLVVSLDVNTKAKISFHSLCHSSIPQGTASVTVVAFPHVPVTAAEAFGEEEDAAPAVAAAPLTGLWPAAEKAVAKGEVYSRDGNWWTVIDADINSALA